MSVLVRSFIAPFTQCLPQRMRNVMAVMGLGGLLLLFVMTPVVGFPRQPDAATTLNRFDFCLLQMSQPLQLASEWFGGDWSRCTLLDRLPVLGAALLIVATAHEAGWWLLRCFGPFSWSASERFVISIGLG